MPPASPGAFHARAAGCTLGAIVENWSVAAMREFAAQTGDAFPPTQYWKEAATPWQVRYEKSACRDYTRTHMDGLPVDDDMTYTALGLLIAEQCGLDFTTADVGRIWLKYLPVACTAEAAALDNLRRGVPAGEAALSNNPYVQWIGADIRSDPFADMAPGWPERAARMAYQDAYLSHRRNGIYGEMFFAAAQSAAFAVNDALEALRIGLTENSGGLSVGSRPTLGAGGSPQPTGLPGRPGGGGSAFRRYASRPYQQQRLPHGVRARPRQGGRHGNPVPNRSHGPGQRLHRRHRRFHCRRHRGHRGGGRPFDRALP